MPWFIRLIVRLVGTIAAATLLVFVMVEISIRGGYRTVVLPTGDSTSPRARALIEEYHLDDHLLERWLHWVVDALQGDFGRPQPGALSSSQTVTDILSHRLPISLQLMLVGVAITLLVGIPVGLLAASWSNRAAGRFVSGTMAIFQAIPIYVSPTILIWIFALKLGWLPASGWTRISDSLIGNIESLILPTLALVLAEIGVVARIVRADVVEVLDSDYIAAAMGKGLDRRYILFRHALRPASLGLLNVVSLNMGSLLSGALVIEIIFGIGGLGQVLLSAMINRDLYLLLGLTSYTVVVYGLLNTAVDAIMFAVDPRIRRS